MEKLFGVQMKLKASYVSNKSVVTTTENGQLLIPKPVHILAAPYGLDNGLFRRVLHLDENNVINVCGRSVKTEWAVKVSDSIATADIVWMDCVHVAKNVKKLNAKLTTMGIQKPNFQKWICASTETSDYYPQLYPFSDLKKRFPNIDSESYAIPII